MAGYNLGFDDGGTVDDEQTPTIPPADDTPAPMQDPSADAGNGQSPEAQGEPAQPGFTPGGASGLGQQVNSGVKRIASYLMGAGATTPQVAQKFEQGVKHENPGISDGDANILAIHKAYELGGPDAAWQMVQFNRMAYNAKTSFAQAALTGTGEKPANPQAAAQAATQASAHVLDGSETQFLADPSGNGFTATVKMPGTSHTVTYQLSPQQMTQLMNVGDVGQWDRIMEHGTPQTLQKLSSAGAPPAADATPQADAPPSGDTPAGTPTDGTEKSDPTADAIKAANEDNQDTDPAPPEANPNAGEKTNVGTTPSTLNLSGSDRQNAQLTPPPHSYGNDIEGAGRAMFPWISQEGQRQQWMAQQANQRSERIAKTGQSAMGAQAKMNVAHETGQAKVQSTQIASDNKKEGVEYTADQRRTGNNEVATTRANAYLEKAKQTAALAAQKMIEQSNNEQMRERGRQFRAELTNPNKVLTTPEEVAALAKKYHIDVPTGAAAPVPQAAPPTGQQPAAQASTTAVPPLAQRQAGVTTVTTAKGTFKWNGKGWDAQ